MKPRHPQTNGLVERFNRDCDVLATARIRSREDLQTTLERYEKLYDVRLPQRAIGYKTRLQTTRIWQTERPELITDRTETRRD